MRLTKSVCTNLVFPESRKSIDEFRRMTAFLNEKGIGCVEFYHDGPERGKIGKVLAESGLEGVYIAVIPSKEGKLWLCDTDHDAKDAAVRMLKNCIDEAAANGIGNILINSGRLTEDVEEGLDALADSVEQAYEYAAGKNYSLRFSLEPCDSVMDAFHLVGPYHRAVGFADKMRKRGFPLELTMDTAHTVEEGEDFSAAVTAAKPYCNHVHFANCRVDNPADPFYGDKHIGFEFSGSVWTPETLTEMFHKLRALYPGDEPLRLALEVLCREDDPYAYFDMMWKSLPLKGV
jgi:sugar phosphate isomerase/epimerase